MRQKTGFGENSLCADLRCQTEESIPQHKPQPHKDLVASRDDAWTPKLVCKIAALCDRMRPAFRLQTVDRRTALTEHKTHDRLRPCRRFQRKPIAGEPAKPNARRPVSSGNRMPDLGGRPALAAICLARGTRRLRHTSGAILSGKRVPRPRQDISHQEYDTYHGSSPVSQTVRHGASV